MRTGTPLDGSVLNDPPRSRAQVPVWLLDVDGVLNAVTRKPDPVVWPRSAWVSTTVTANGEALLIHIAQPVLDLLSEVHATGAAEIRWHTTWRNERAVDILADAYGLPAFPIEEAPEFDPSTPAGHGGPRRGLGWWKLPAAERVAASGRALLWTDDDLIAAYRLLGLGTVNRLGDRLLISPDERTGLTQRHVREIRAWLGL